MYVFNIIRKIVCKIIVLFLLGILTIFNSVLKIAVFLFGLAAVPVASLAAIAVVVMGCMDGFSMDTVAALLCATLLVCLKFLLPLIPEALDRVKLNMKDYLYEPLVVRSPVKYTI